MGGSWRCPPAIRPCSATPPASQSAADSSTSSCSRARCCAGRGCSSSTRRTSACRSWTRRASQRPSNGSGSVALLSSPSPRTGSSVRLQTGWSCLRMAPPSRRTCKTSSKKRPPPPGVLLYALPPVRNRRYVLLYIAWPIRYVRYSHFMQCDPPPPYGSSAFYANCMLSVFVIGGATACFFLTVRQWQPKDQERAVVARVGLAQ
mmetsp:Transcript_25697/g.59950  ORF Transcript_25697/g.59950 Transcript_25697/m.59950 type:complete len:204 (-) Transcript_25697:147-758(-)